MSMKWREERTSLDKLDRRRVAGHVNSDALKFCDRNPNGTLRYPGEGCEKSMEGWNYLWSKTKVRWGITNMILLFSKKTKGIWNVYNKRYSRVDNSGNPIDREFSFSEFDYFRCVQYSTRYRRNNFHIWCTYF